MLRELGKPPIAPQTNVVLNTKLEVCLTNIGDAWYPTASLKTPIQQPSHGAQFLRRRYENHCLENTAMDLSSGY